MLDTIRLKDVKPNVFSDSGVAGSEVWLSDLTFRRGGRYLVEASSGRGKTSLCSFLTGMRKDYSGSILFDGVDVSGFNTSRWSSLRESSLAWLPQELGLFGKLTLLENVVMKNNLTGYLSEAEIIDLAGRLGLGDKIDTKASILSIGQQQRVAFLRMLCQPADFFILDEPVSHLDEANNKILSDLLEEALERTGAGVIVTSVGNRLELKGLTRLVL